MKSRSKLRAEAKKVYREQVKAQNVPKRQRMPFSQFFKQYLELYKKQKQVQEQEQESQVDTSEDFDFENMVNMNEISDDDVEVSEGKE